MGESSEWKTIFKTKVTMLQIYCIIYLLNPLLNSEGSEDYSTVERTRGWEVPRSSLWLSWKVDDLRLELRSEWTYTQYHPPVSQGSQGDGACALEPLLLPTC